jgi:hypothetical protein
VSGHDHPAASLHRETLEAAHLIDSFSVFVHGATDPKGDRAVILAVIPPGERGWTFPLPVEEARRIAALLVERADA